MSPVADCEGMEHYMLLIECHWTLNKFIFVTQGGPGQPGLCGWRPAEYLESVNAMYGGSEKGTSFFWTNNNVKYLFVYVLGDKELKDKGQNYIWAKLLERLSVAQILTSDTAVAGRQ